MYPFAQLFQIIIISITNIIVVVVVVVKQKHLLFSWYRLASASDKVYKLLAHGRWFSPSTPASSATETSRHDIPVAELLLKMA